MSQERNKEPVCDAKVKSIKLEGGTAAHPPPVAGKNLNRSVRSKLQPGDSSFFPSVVLRTPWRPAALSAATGAWLGALVVRIYLRLLDRTANQHENRTTMKVFSYINMGEGVERTARRMRGTQRSIYAEKCTHQKGFSLRRGSAVGGGEV